MTRALLLTLALTWACSDGVRPGAIVEGATDQADQLLIHMSHQLLTSGVVRARVEADSAFLYSATQTADLRRVRVTFFDRLGHETSTLTAQTGTYDWRTGNMVGRGNVLVVTTDDRRLETQVLRYDQAKDSVSTELPFVFDAPDRHIEGEGFTSDPSFRDVVAKRPHGTGGGFTLPDQ